MVNPARPPGRSREVGGRLEGGESWRVGRLKSLGSIQIISACISSSGESDGISVYIPSMYTICTYKLRHQSSDIFNTPPEGGGLRSLRTLPVERRQPPPDFFCFFKMFLMFSNINLPFAHIYTPPNILLYPPNFKFLEITLHQSRLQSCRKLYLKHCNEGLYH